MGRENGRIRASSRDDTSPSPFRAPIPPSPRGMFRCARPKEASSRYRNWGDLLISRRGGRAVAQDREGKETYTRNLPHPVEIQRSRGRDIQRPKQKSTISLDYFLFRKDCILASFRPRILRPADLFGGSTAALHRLKSPSRCGTGRFAPPLNGGFFPPVGRSTGFNLADTLENQARMRNL